MVWDRKIDNKSAKILCQHFDIAKKNGLEAEYMEFLIIGLLDGLDPIDASDWALNEWDM